MKNRKQDIHMHKLSHFFESIYFIIIVHLVTVICWSYKRPDLAFLFYIVLMILVLLSKANRIVLASLLMAGNLNFFRKDGGFASLFSQYFPIFFPLGAIGIGILVFDFIRNRHEIHVRNPILYGLLLILGANILSVVSIPGSESETALYLNAMLGIGQFLGYSLLFLFFMNCNNQKSRLYFSQTVLITGLAITAELLLHFIAIGSITGKGDYDLGWGVSNSIAMFYSVMLPIGLYTYFENQKRIDVLLISGINTLMMMFMLSRGAYATFAILIIPFLIVTVIFAANRKKYFLDITITAFFSLIAGYLLIWKFELFEPLLEYIRALSLDPSGREEIFQTGIDLFRKHWLFGAGSYSGMTYLAPFHLYTYHNYWIHTLATTGIVGLIAFVYYLIMILKSCFLKNRYNLLVLFSVLVMMIHGLVDNTFYNPKIMLFLSVILPLLVQNEKQPVVEIINLPDHSQA